MRRYISSWSTLFTRLGFVRNQNRPARRTNYRRRLSIENFEHRRMLATFIVNSALVGSDGGNLTLREAIAQANIDDLHDTIIFAPAVFNTPKTILLTEGELLITESVTIDGTIDGAGPSQVLLNITIDADGGGDGVVGDFDGFRIFNIQDVNQVEINGLTLTGGEAPTPGASGGAIHYSYFGEPPVGSGLIIKNSEITGNASFNRGGGIYTTGNLRVENSTISNNWTGIGVGGGIAVVSGYDSVLEVLSNTTISGEKLKGTGVIFLDWAARVAVEWLACPAALVPSWVVIRTMCSIELMAG